jgi:crotonobetainyl-CoA:carnitine CoA-transferase CaiB-like acyl-CoA transferase
MTETKSAGPLAGLNVLDVTRVLSGPWAGQTLADLGAAVIKIEQPKLGDDFRRSPPHIRDAQGRTAPLESSLYLSTNRNKKSVTLNLAAREGQQLLRRLAAASDILVENSRAGAMQRRGLGYDSLSRDNPGLIYCSISGFGQTGPHADKAGYDSTFQAMSGMMSYSGRPDGTPGAGPIRTGPSLCDVNAGMYAVVAILAALHHRGKTGRGQFIDLGMLDTTLAMVSHHAMGRLVAGFNPPRSGNGSAFGAPTDCFPCRDRLVMINGAENRNFPKLCKVLGFPELAEDPRFKEREQRVANQAVLYDLIAARTRERDSRELLAALEEAGLPVAPVHDTDGAYEDAQVRHRRMLREAPHPIAGMLTMVANPINYSETPLERYDAPPLLGQHTDEVLTGVLGLADEEIARLRSEGVV